MRWKEIGLRIAVVFLVAILLCSPIYAEPCDPTSFPDGLPEILELRQANSKAYRLNGTQIKYELFTSNIHYLDEEGIFQEIDNSIVSVRGSDYRYKNNKNSWAAYFGDNKVYLDDGKYSVSFELQNISGKSSLIRSNENRELSDYDQRIADDNRVVIYKDALPGIDVAYTVHDSMLKEDIVLRSYNGINEFVFKVNTFGLKLVVKDGIIVFTDSIGEIISVLGKLFMYDANGKYSENLKYSLDIIDDSHYVTITADNEFLQSPSTVYPVVIDPTYFVQQGANGIVGDTFVSVEYPNANYYNADLLALSGTYNSAIYGYKETAIFIKFSGSCMPDAFPISSATLHLTKKDSYGTGLAPEVSSTDSYWHEGTLTWNNRNNMLYCGKWGPTCLGTNTQQTMQLTSVRLCSIGAIKIFPTK